MQASGSEKLLNRALTWIPLLGPGLGLWTAISGVNPITGEMPEASERFNQGMLAVVMGFVDDKFGLSASSNGMFGFAKFVTTRTVGVMTQDLTTEFASNWLSPEWAFLIGLGTGIMAGYGVNKAFDYFANLGILTNEQIIYFKNQAINNPNSDTFVLGTIGSYDVVGDANGYSFFKMSDDVWDDLVTAAKENYDEVWKINSEFIDDQINSGKNIVLANDPNAQYFLANGKPQFYQRELDYLRSLGYSFEKMDSGLWQAIKK